MPKEKVSDKVVDTVVCWGDDYVQLATIASGTEGSANPDYGWYTTLSEENIDRLIRALKRARKRVFEKNGS